MQALLHTGLGVSRAADWAKGKQSGCWTLIGHIGSVQGIMDQPMLQLPPLRAVSPSQGCILGLLSRLEPAELAHLTGG